VLGLLLGAVLLFALLGGLRAFERASVRSVKSLLAWIAALGGLSLALMLILTGRGPVALAALTFLGPLVYQHLEPRLRSQSSRFRPKPKQTMSRAEAYEVLGLQPGASKQEIRQAHLRLMRAAHPDAGGSDWLASRINHARDILLG
jgi:DnaJ homolog subfamily C member 19